MASLGNGGHDLESRIMSAPEMKAAYKPLVDMILAKKVKRKGDINGLSMPAPLGLKPKDVSKDVAIEFVKVFIPAMWKVIIAEKKKKTMGNLRKHLAASSGGATGGEGTPAKAPASSGASKTAAPAPKPKKVDEIAEMKKKGMTDDQILREKGLSFERRTAMKDAFDFYDETRAGHISKEDLIDIFAKFDKAYDNSDIEFLIGMLTSSNGGTPSNTLSFVRFALFMESMMGDAEEIFNSSYHLFTHTAGKPKEISKEQLVTGMKKMNAPFSSKQADAFLKNGKTMKDFSKQMAKMLDDKPPQIAGAGGGGATKKAGGAAKAAKPKEAIKIDPNDPKYKKFFRMIKFHQPRGAAMAKAKSEGLTEEELEALDKALPGK